MKVLKSEKSYGKVISPIPGQIISCGNPTVGPENQINQFDDWSDDSSLNDDPAENPRIIGGYKIIFKYQLI